MAVLVDVQIQALLNVIKRHLNGDQTLTMKRTWLTDFRDTIGNTSLLPIETSFMADWAHLNAPWEGNASYPIFCLWRASDNWTEFSYDTDGNSAVALFKWVLPSDAETERITPLFQRFTFELRRCLEEAVEDVVDRPNLDAAGVSAWCTDLKVKYGYDGPQGNIIYPTATGSFDFTQHWKRTVTNLGLDLPWLNSVEHHENIKGNGQDGDAAPKENPLVRGIAKVPTPS